MPAIGERVSAAGLFDDAAPAIGQRVSSEGLFDDFPLPAVTFPAGLETAKGVRGAIRPLDAALATEASMLDSLYNLPGKALRALPFGEILANRKPAESEMPEDTLSPAPETFAQQYEHSPIPFSGGVTPERLRKGLQESPIASRAGKIGGRTVDAASSLPALLMDPALAPIVMGGTAGMDRYAEGVRNNDPQALNVGLKTALAQGVLAKLPASSLGIVNPVGRAAAGVASMNAMNVAGAGAQAGIDGGDFWGAVREAVSPESLIANSVVGGALSGPKAVGEVRNARTYKAQVDAAKQARSTASEARARRGPEFDSVIDQALNPDPARRAALPQRVRDMADEPKRRAELRRMVAEDDPSVSPEERQAAILEIARQDSEDLTAASMRGPQSDNPNLYDAETQAAWERTAGYQSRAKAASEAKIAEDMRQQQDAAAQKASNAASRRETDLDMARRAAAEAKQNNREIDSSLIDAAQARFDETKNEHKTARAELKAALAEKKALPKDAPREAVSYINNNIAAQKRLIKALGPELRARKADLDSASTGLLAPGGDPYVAPIPEPLTVTLQAAAGRAPLAEPSPPLPRGGVPEETARVEYGVRRSKSGNWWVTRNGNDSSPHASEQEARARIDRNKTEDAQYERDLAPYFDRAREITGNDPDTTPEELRALAEQELQSDKDVAENKRRDDRDYEDAKAFSAHREEGKASVEKALEGTEWEIWQHSNRGYNGGWSGYEQEGASNYIKLHNKTTGDVIDVRLSDHAQPEFGGYRINADGSEGRGGPSDVSLVAKPGQPWDMSALRDKLAPPAREAQSAAKEPQLATDTARIMAAKKAAEEARQQEQEARASRESGDAFTKLPQKSQDVFNAAFESGDTAKMSESVAPNNKTWRAEFERRSGVKLPRNAGDTARAVGDYFTSRKPAAPPESPVPESGSATSEQAQAPKPQASAELPFLQYDKTGKVKGGIEGREVRVQKNPSGGHDIIVNDKLYDTHESLAAARRAARDLPDEFRRDDAAAREMGTLPRPASDFAPLVDAIAAAAKKGQAWVADLHDQIVPHLDALREKAKNATDFTIRAVQQFGKSIRPYVDKYLKMQGKNNAGYGPIGPESIKEVGRKTRDFVVDNLTTWGSMPKAGRSLVERQRAFKAGEEHFATVIERDVRHAAEDTNTPKEVVDKAWETRNLLGLDPRVAAKLSIARNRIGANQGRAAAKLREIAAEEPDKVMRALYLERAGMLEKSKNAADYSTRMYRMFDVSEDEAVRLAKAMPEWKTEAVKRGPGGDADLENSIRQMYSTMKPSSKLGRGDQSSFKKLKDIPAPMRKLMGEKTSFSERYAGTTETVAEIVASLEFQHGMAKAGLGDFLARAKDAPEGWQKIGGDDQVSLGPLMNLYAPPRIKKIFNEMLSGPRDETTFGKMMNYLTVVGKRNVTSLAGLAPIVRQSLGNTLFGVAAVGPKNLARELPRAARLAFEHANVRNRLGAKMDTPSSRAEIQNLTERNLLDTEVTIHNTMEQEGRGGVASPWETYKAGSRAAYRGPDNGIKIAVARAMEKELSSVFKTKQELQDYVTEKIRRWLPNPELEPKGLKALGNTPIAGSFLNYSVTTDIGLFNQVHDTIQEIAKPQKPGLRTIAMRRVPRLIAAMTAPLMAQATSKYNSGITDEEERMFRESQGTFGKDATYLWTGKDKNGVPTGINITFINPYPIIGALSLAYNNPSKDAGDKALSMLKGYGSAYLGGTILTASGFTLVSSVLGNGSTLSGYPLSPAGATLPERVVDTAMEVGRPFVPGGSRTMQMAASLGSGKYYGREVGVGESATNLLTGIKHVKAKPLEALARDVKAAGGKINEKALIERRVADGMSKEQATASVDAQRKELFDDLHRRTKDMIASGLTAPQIRKALKEANVSDEQATRILNGQYQKYQPKEQARSGYRRRTRRR